MSKTLPSCIPGQTRLGWVGAGVMGHSMCRHLLAAGFQVTVHSRTRSKAESLLELGASWASSPKAVAESSEIVFVIVGMPAEVEAVFLADDGLLGGGSAGKILVDMSTSPPELARRIATVAEPLGMTLLDAPVSGGDVGARNATLSIMVGGDKTAFMALDPCWQALGKTIVHQGPVGSGQHTKMVNQILIAAGMIGVCEALLYAFQAGLDLNLVLQSVSGGAAGSWSLSNLAPRIVADNFEPGFYVDHFVKDLGIAIGEAEQLGLNLPGLHLAQSLYLELQQQGGGQWGTQALQKSLAQMSGIDWENRNR